MTSAFTELGSLLSNAVDAAFGQQLAFTPKRPTDNFGNPTAGDNRQSGVVTGSLLRGVAQMSFADGDRRKTEFNARASRQDAHATFDRSQFTNGLPRQGDVIATTAPDPIERFEVVDTYDSGSRIICALVVTK